MPTTPVSSCPVLLANGRFSMWLQDLCPSPFRVCMRRTPSSSWGPPDARTHSGMAPEWSPHPGFPSLLASLSLGSAHGTSLSPAFQDLPKPVRQAPLGSAHQPQPTSSLLSAPPWLTCPPPVGSHRRPGKASPPVCPCLKLATPQSCADHR